jgi:hypothetical protein
MTIKELVSNAKEGKYIYRPIWEELNTEYYNKFFEYCYKRGNTIVWVDELGSVASGAMNFPDYLRAIYTRGRQLNVVIWGLTQRPFNVPIICMSEASHIICFSLNMQQDRERVAMISESDELLKKPDIVAKNEYAFWYHNVKKNTTTLGVLKENKK